MLFNFLLSFFNFIVSFLPNADTNILSFETSKVTQFNDLISGVSWLLPVDTIIQIILAVMGIEALILGFRVIKWFLGIIPILHFNN
jgi:hypothetical protein